MYLKKHGVLTIEREMEEFSVTGCLIVKKASREEE